MADDTLRVAGVRLTSPGKLLYPDEGITKRQVADYYLRVAERMLPYVAGRLLSLVRCPQGRGSKCFFQKHDSGHKKMDQRRSKEKRESGGRRGDRATSGKGGPWGATSATPMSSRPARRRW